MLAMGRVGADCRALAWGMRMWTAMVGVVVGACHAAAVAPPLRNIAPVQVEAADPAPTPAFLVTYVAGAPGLVGVVRDVSTRELLAGVTLVATAPPLPQSHTAITDEHGAFAIVGLPEGTYLLTAYYADVTLESPVRVVAGRRTVVTIDLDQSKAGVEVCRFGEPEPFERLRHPP